MALNKTILETQAKLAFKSSITATTANILATAIDDFVKGGKMSIPCVGTWTSPTVPPVTTNITTTAESSGSLITVGPSALETVIISALTNPTTWALVGSTLATGINTHVSATTASITNFGSYSNVPPAPAIATVVGATFMPALSTAINIAFTTPYAGTVGTWDWVATQVADAINAYVTAVQVSVTGAGNTPLTSWTAAGVLTGNIS